MEASFVFFAALAAVAAFAAGAFVGSAAGFAVGRRERSVAELIAGPADYDDPNDDTCGCGHHQAFHVSGRARCSHEDEWGDRDCSCQCYVKRRPRVQRPELGPVLDLEGGA